MNGLAGIFAVDGRTVQRQEIEQLVASLHGGGAQGAVWNAGRIGLGYSGGLQPARTERHAKKPGKEEGYMVVADARLDNRDDLLHMLGEPAGRSTEAALIQSAYEKWGAACPEYLLGAYAFAVWDAAQDMLYCACDHLGQRPLYYLQTRENFAFASTIKALLVLPWVQRRVDEECIADYLLQQYDDAAGTFYQNIRKLPAAHCLTVKLAGTRLQRYWALDPRPTLRLPSDEAYAEAFESHFTEAVRCCLRGGGKVGTLLSGGLDSSGITGVARALCGAEVQQPLNTFSLVFDEVQASDERPYIEAMLRQGGLRPHYIHGDRHHALENLDALLDRLGGPFFTANLFLHDQLYAAAREADMDILLDGFLGDSVVGHGTRYLTELAMHGRWMELHRALRMAAAFQPKPRKARRAFLKHFVLEPLLQEPWQYLWQQLVPPVRPSGVKGHLINADFARRMGGHARISQARTPRTVRQEEMRELGSAAVPNALASLHHMASVHGVEPRYPFADRRLMMFCLSLPSAQKFRGGWTRHVERQGLRKYLPDEIYRRHGKAQASHNFGYGLRTRGRSVFQELLIEQVMIAAPYVDVEAVRESARAFLAGSGRGDTAGALWQVAVLVRWLQRERQIGQL